MPWYKIEAQCGPGHQSHSVYYHFSRRRLKEPQRKELWSEKFEGRDAACGKVIRVGTLPAGVHREMVESHTRGISYAQGMLEILENTPAETKYRGYVILWTRGLAPHSDGWSKKLSSEGFVVRTKKGDLVLPDPRMWFHGESGAKHAIDIWIEVRKNSKRFFEERDRRRKNLREARRIVNAQRHAH